MAIRKEYASILLCILRMILFCTTTSNGDKKLSDGQGVRLAIDCRVLDWSVMVCRWSPVIYNHVTDDGNTTSVPYQLWWKIADSNASYTACSTAAPGSCAWHSVPGSAAAAARRLDLEQLYSMRLQAELPGLQQGEERYGYITPAFTVNPLTIVKPGPVLGLVTPEIESWWFQVQWRATSLQHPVLYTINITQQVAPLRKFLRSRGIFRRGINGDKITDKRSHMQGHSKVIPYAHAFSRRRRKKFSRRLPDDLEYKVFHTMQTSVTISAQESNSSDTVTWSGVRPYLRYKVHVYSVPIVNEEPMGYRSDVAVIDVTTQGDVCGAVPRWAGGLYQTVMSQGRMQVLVYWQHLLRQFAHGELRNILIHYVTQPLTSHPAAITANENATILENTPSCHCDNSSCFKIPYNESVTYATLPDLNLDVEKTYYLYIEAENEMGCNRNLDLGNAQRPIVIRGGNRVPGPERLVVRKNSTSGYTHVHWRAPAITHLQVVSGFTVYWCPSFLLDTFKSCTQDVQWQGVNHTLYEHEFFDLDRALGYEFALSMETSDADDVMLSSGLVFAGCVHDMELPILAPRRVRFVKNASLHDGQLQMSWQNPPRCKITAYIEQYEIRVWKKSDQDQNTVSFYVDASQQSYIISDLEPGTKYYSLIRSVSPWQISEFRRPEQGYGKSAGSRTHYILWMVMAILFAVLIAVCVAVGVICVALRRCKKAWKGPVEITTPLTLSFDANAKRNVAKDTKLGESNEKLTDLRKDKRNMDDQQKEHLLSRNAAYTTLYPDKIHDVRARGESDVNDARAVADFHLRLCRHDSGLEHSAVSLRPTQAGTDAVEMQPLFNQIANQTSNQTTNLTTNTDDPYYVHTHGPRGAMATNCQHPQDSNPNPQQPQTGQFVYTEDDLEILNADNPDLGGTYLNSDENYQEEGEDTNSQQLNSGGYVIKPVKKKRPPVLVQNPAGYVINANENRPRQIKMAVNQHGYVDNASVADGKLKEACSRRTENSEQELKVRKLSKNGSVEKVNNTNPFVTDNHTLGGEMRKKKAIASNGIESDIEDYIFSISKNSNKKPGDQDKECSVIEPQGKTKHNNNITIKYLPNLTTCMPKTPVETSVRETNFGSDIPNKNANGFQLGKVTPQNDNIPNMVENQAQILNDRGYIETVDQTNPPLYKQHDKESNGYVPNADSLPAKSDHSKTVPKMFENKAPMNITMNERGYLENVDQTQPSGLKQGDINSKEYVANAEFLPAMHDLLKPVPPMAENHIPFSTTVNDRGYIENMDQVQPSVWKQGNIDSNGYVANDDILPANSGPRFVENQAHTNKTVNNREYIEHVDQTQPSLSEQPVNSSIDYVANAEILPANIDSRMVENHSHMDQTLNERGYIESMNQATPFVSNQRIMDLNGYVAHDESLNANSDKNQAHMSQTVNANSDQNHAHMSEKTVNDRGYIEAVDQAKPSVCKHGDNDSKDYVANTEFLPAKCDTINLTPNAPKMTANGYVFL